MLKNRLVIRGCKQDDPRMLFRNYYSASDPGWSELSRETGNLKYKGPLMTARFCMSTFKVDRGVGVGPLCPALDP